MNLETLDIPLECLSDIVPSADPEAFGTTDLASPLGNGMTMGRALGDQQAALFSYTCFAPGGGKKHLWHRVLFLLFNTAPNPTFSSHGLLTISGYHIKGTDRCMPWKAPLPMPAPWCNGSGTTWT